MVTLLLTKTFKKHWRRGRRGCSFVVESKALSSMSSSTKKNTYIYMCIKNRKHNKHHASLIATLV
jgi:hypothetical protein